MVFQVMKKQLCWCEIFSGACDFFQDLELGRFPSSESSLKWIFERGRIILLDSYLSPVGILQSRGLSLTNCMATHFSCCQQSI